MGAKTGVCVCVCVCKLLHTSTLGNMSRVYLQCHQNLSQMPEQQSREVGRRTLAQQSVAVLEQSLLPSGAGVAAVTQVRTPLSYCDTGTHTYTPQLL